MAIACTCTSEYCPHQKFSTMNPACDKSQAPGDGMYCDVCRTHWGLARVADKKEELERERAVS